MLQNVLPVGRAEAIPNNGLPAVMRAVPVRALALA